MYKLLKLRLTESCMFSSLSTFLYGREFVVFCYDFHVDFLICLTAGYFNDYKEAQL